MTSAESIGPVLEGFSALFVGLFVACFFAWQVALCCLGLIPFMVIAGAISRHIMQK